jgi:hypothetical protein
MEELIQKIVTDDIYKEALCKGIIISFEQTGSHKLNIAFEYDDFRASTPIYTDTNDIRGKLLVLYDRFTEWKRAQPLSN